MTQTNAASHTLRKLLHQRSIACDAYLRTDGLWEAEARLRDSKPFAYRHFARGVLQPGDAIHEMMLCVTVDDDLTIREARSEMTAIPFLSCQDVTPVVNKLVGLRLSAGWRKGVRERIARLETCTHLMDLLMPITTTLYQAIGMGKSPEGKNALEKISASTTTPFFIDGCYSWRADGENVRAIFPEYATAPEEPAPDANERG